jgi:hypothetical protein
MSDILADYREWAAAQPARVSTHSDRCHMWPRHERCMIHRLARALEAARLTDAEREAVETSFDSLQYAADELGLSQADCDRMVATLRGLLERTK